MGTQRQPNRLIHSTSPYLLQHAYNPVDWYPWSDEAFNRAKAEDKPIFLSIGYASCHWCHVMEKESFENEEIARLLNTYFVSIKVDREERPDIDAVYMEVVQALTGRGGWPMSVFLTPEKVPFYAGTYFPPEDRWGIPSFHRVLQSVAEAYTNRKATFIQFGVELLNQIQNQAWAETPVSSGPEILSHALKALQITYDPRWGGFEEAPKFPNPALLRFLLQYEPDSSIPTESSPSYLSQLEMAEGTLQGMARGGIFDHLGGGFHRYSVDSRWLVPHFEKMLYDNALLAHLYIEAFQVTGNPLYKKTAEKTIDYLLREMRDPEGGFYSSQDADSPPENGFSETQEGFYYLWDYQELQQALGDDFPLFAKLYGIQPKGNFEGKSILHLAYLPETLCKETGVSADELQAIESRSLFTLQTLRKKRPAPPVDDKILTAWNGMALKALSSGGILFDRKDWIQAATACGEFLKTSLKTKEGTLLRGWRRGIASPIPGFLEDYAHAADGFLSLYEATLESGWLKEARTLMDMILDRFWDASSNTLLDREKGAGDLIIPPRMWYDHPTPSGTSIAIEVLFRLSYILQAPTYHEVASTALAKKLSFIKKHPHVCGQYLCCILWMLNPPVEITLTGDTISSDFRALHKVAYGVFIPQKVVSHISSTAISSTLQRQEKAPILNTLSNQKVTAVVCFRGTCHQPVHSPEELTALLKRVQKSFSHFQYQSHAVQNKSLNHS